MYADLARANGGIFTEIGQVMGPMVRGDREAAERAMAATSLVWSCVVRRYSGVNLRIQCVLILDSASNSVHNLRIQCVE